MSDLILEMLRSTFVAIVLSLTRMTSASLIVPFMAGETLQLPVRATILASLGLSLYPVIAPTVPAELGTLQMMGLFLKEAMLGLLIGFMAAKIFWIAAGVGMIVDNQRGATMSDLIDPASNEQMSPTGILTQQMMIALFYTTGGFLLFLTVLFESYVTWPVFSFYPRLSASYPEFFLGQLDEIMRMTVVVAAPLLVTLFISEFGLGLINRFAPQLNVFSLAMPVKSLVAVLVLIFYLPYLTEYLCKSVEKTGEILQQLQTVIL